MQLRVKYCRIRRMIKRYIAAAFAAVCIASNVAHAASAPRISGFQRCGDLLDNRHFEFCVDVSNGGSGETKLLLNGKQLATHSSGEKSLRFKVDWSQHVSGAFWVQQGKQRSNAVWLSLQDSATVVAEDDEVTRNAEGITTFIDLVSIIVEEEFDALQEARRVAKKYGAHVVGSIPPLRIYQLRLPVTDLDHRDALVLRLDGEESIDRVMIEESSPAGDKEQDEQKAQAQSASRMNEVAANRFMDAVDYYRRRVPGPATARIKPAAQRLGVIERALDFDSPDFTGLINPKPGAVRLYGRDAENPNGHGSTVAGVLAASWNDGGNSGFLSGLDGHHGGIDIIVDRGSDAGIVANVATPVRSLTTMIIDYRRRL